MDQLRWLAQAGKGATAYVFKAADGNGKNYAVKVRKPAIASTSAMEDFCRAFEGNIVTLYKTAFDPLPDGCVDLLLEAERPPFAKKLRRGARRPVDCLIMDYHDSTLFQAVDRAREETTTYSKLIVRVLLGLVSAVEYVLSQGVLHMDLKEDNVLVNNEG